MAGYMSVWPLFGSANQLLSALVLTGLAVFLKATGRKGWMLYGIFIKNMCQLITAQSSSRVCYHAINFISF